MPKSSNIISNIDIPPSMKEIAFQALKQAIMRNELIPGAIYSEQVLAKEMGVSKTPVHLALVELENKGFVNLLSRRGFEVKALSAKNISEMFELRRSLEKTVVRKITPKLRADELNKLSGIVARIEKTRDPVDFQKHDRAFHRYLAALSGNSYITNALEMVWDLSDWVGASILKQKGGYKSTAQEHLAIYEFMAGGDSEKAAAAMERHLNSTETRFLENFGSDEGD